MSDDERVSAVGQENGWGPGELNVALHADEATVPLGAVVAVAALPTSILGSLPRQGGPAANGVRPAPPPPPTFPRGTTPRSPPRAGTSAELVAGSEGEPSAAPGSATGPARSLWDPEDGGGLVGRSAGADFAGVPGSAPPEAGTRINHYEVIRKLGEGGMGMVFLARDLRLGRRVAIKLLQAEQSALTRRFLVEARATARCQHDNIVVLYEVGEHGASPYLVLEYLEGNTLSALIENGRRLPHRRALEIMAPILRALQCAHDHGVVHRDLKPDNVFLTDSGTVKVLDFGIAKVTPPPQRGCAELAPRPDLVEPTASAGAGLTQSGTIMGTTLYMSPEQWGIGVELDHLTDVWAAGLLLYRMICGRHPLYPLQGTQLIATAMLDQPMPSLGALAPPDVPRELIAIVDRCLLKRKAQRWQSAAELLAALEPFLPGRRRIAPPFNERVQPSPALPARGASPASASAGPGRAPRWLRTSAGCR